MASCFLSSHIHNQEGKSQELGNVCITHFMDNYFFEMLIRLLRKISISSFQNCIEIEKTTYSERFIYKLCLTELIFFQQVSWEH